MLNLTADDKDIDDSEYWEKTENEETNEPIADIAHTSRLCCQTSASIERFFSLIGNILEDLRKSMKMSTLMKWSMCKWNLYIRCFRNADI